MSMSTTNSDQKLTDIGSGGSDNNNFFNNLEMSQHLFDKVLTPTDVARKAPRIVIPKQHAMDYFPPLFVNRQRRRVLYFTDRNGKEWKFSYCYWRTCRMYVLSHGWEKFLEDKQFVSGDTVSFHCGYIPDNNIPERRRKIMCIDWRRKGEVNLVTNNTESPSDDNHQWNLGRSEPLVCNWIPAFPIERVHPSEPSQPSMTKKMRLFGVDMEETKKMRLFGVDIEDSSSSIGYSSLSPEIIRDEGQSSQRSSCGEMGASSSSFKQLSDNEDPKRKGKSVRF